MYPYVPEGWGNLDDEVSEDNSDTIFRLTRCADIHAGPVPDCSFLDYFRKTHSLWRKEEWKRT